MLRAFFKASGIALLMAVCCGELTASRFQPVSVQELKMTSEPNAPGAAAIVLSRQVDRDDNGLTSHEDNYFRIKILTEEGRKYADVEIPFFKDQGNIVNIHARTIRPDGSIVEFAGRIFDKTIAKSKGLKYQARTFTLPDVEVGGLIEYYYTIDLSEHYVFDSHWILSNELFTKNARFSLKPYQGFYSTLKLQWNWSWLPPGTPAPKEGPDNVVRLEVNNIPAFQTEDFMPPENEMKSRVNFIYSEDQFQPDATKYWKTAGKRLNGKLESFVGKRQAMEQAVSEIVSRDDPPETKLRKIYARVQRLRNTSYEVHKTEEEKKREKEKEATNVEEVWKRGYGTGFQLTWLYLALVRASGFEAYGVWVADRGNYLFLPSFLDSSRLDANVVLVKVGGKDNYYDPGAAMAPFGMLPWAETGVPGLRLDKDGGTWVQTTLPESADSRIEHKADLKLSGTGDLEGKLKLTFVGLEAMQRRVEERNQDDTERKKFLEDEVRDEVPGAIEIELSNTRLGRFRSAIDRRVQAEDCRMGFRRGEPSSGPCRTFQRAGEACLRSRKSYISNLLRISVSTS